MGRKSELPLESRIEAVLAVLRKDEPMSIIARRYQVSEVTLSRWRDGFLEGGEGRYRRRRRGRRRRRAP